MNIKLDKCVDTIELNSNKLTLYFSEESRSYMGLPVLSADGRSFETKKSRAALRSKYHLF